MEFRILKGWKASEKPRYPPLTRVLGHRATASALPLLAAVCSALAFLQPEPTIYGQLVHVVTCQGEHHLEKEGLVGFHWETMGNSSMIQGGL